jgi:argininosuccinate lyase
MTIFQGLKQRCVASARTPSAVRPVTARPDWLSIADATTSALGFNETQAPVTAVQLSRGKAESGLLFELTLLVQDLGRLASDLLLFYTQEFGYVELATEVTTGSSIMPQKRNPDVLELIRAASATAQAGLDECLMITAKLPSGYQRDLQRLKGPVFRSIDLAIDERRHHGFRRFGPGVQAGPNSPDDRSRCCRAGQSPRDRGGYPVPRGLPAGR